MAQTQLLSRVEKFKMMQFLISELAKEKGIILGDEAAEIINSVHTSNGAALQLMQLLESEQKQAQNV
ncbi:MAG: hypothetical protein HC916_18825 [Coleofasciculaceae cyanobacterium SM2_1_6]|nr:hypothetical protein [Coleofasciculaceae cyanobacterium SM2_1_6]